VVADGGWGAEPDLLDRQSISGAAATHTHTHTGGRESRIWNATEQNYGFDGAGHSNGGRISRILAVEVPEQPKGLELASDTKAQSKRSSVLGRAFNADGRIADFKNAEEVMELMYGPK